MTVHTSISPATPPRVGAPRASSWRDGDEAVYLRNCPFHQLAARHPGLVCGMNLALIGGMVDGLEAGGMRPGLAPGSGRCCVVIAADKPATDMSKTGAS